jgi:hypothetical protein
VRGIGGPLDRVGDGRLTRARRAGDPEQEPAPVDPVE